MGGWNQGTRTEPCMNASDLGIAPPWHKVTVHLFWKMRSCVLMCMASLCRTEIVAQIYLLELTWRGLARLSMQCSSMSELFRYSGIDDCVSLYYTTHASCDIFKLVVNGLAKKRNGSAGLYRSTQRTSLSYAGDSCGNIPKFFEGRSYNHGQWMLCCWTQRYKEMVGSSAINWKLLHNNLQKSVSAMNE